MSSWVQEEADEGRERGILIPLLIDPVKPPMGFRSVQTANLVNWNGEIQSPAKSVFRLDEYLALYSRFFSTSATVPVIHKERCLPLLTSR
jgi:hypothetical protein